MRIILLVVCFLWTAASYSVPRKIDGMYVNTFGNPHNQSLIFIHGGPGFNSWDFELTTAPVLARLGYYVVVYDQKGQGRSEETESANFTYNQYAHDLKEIIDSLKLSHPILLAHSHGGPIGITFDTLYPDVAKKIALLSAPLNFVGNLQSLLNNSYNRYQKAGNQLRLSQLTQLYYKIFIEGSSNPIHISRLFSLAAESGLYATENLTSDALRLWDMQRSTPISGPVVDSAAALRGFLENEKYLGVTGITYVVSHSSKFCGIYGEEDGLFSPLEINLIKIALTPKKGGESSMKLLKGASHFVYIDQQPAFIEALISLCSGN